MSTRKKIALAAGIAVAIAAITGTASYYSRKGVVTVQTGKVQRLDLTSIVSASGEIKPKTYVNIGANAFGKITRLYVKEGDRVKKGQLLAQLENVQSTADVNATQASLEVGQTDAVAAEAALNTSVADLNRAKSDAERAKLDWDRAQGLYKDQLIAKSEYDSRKNAWEAAEAGLAQGQSRIAQAKAQKDSADKRIAQNRANLTRVSDVLQKTTYEAPFDGMITNLPVRVGETVVPVPLLQVIAELPEENLHRGLAHLQEAEFLYETRLFPERAFTFKHPLTHEVAYGSLLQERRRVLHARIVEALEALAGDRVAEQVERLAHHALRGEVWDKALTY